MRLAFGVTPRQRVQPVVEEVERLIQKPAARKPAAAVAAGMALALLALTVGARRAPK